MKRAFLGLCVILQLGACSLLRKDPLPLPPGAEVSEARKQEIQAQLSKRSAALENFRALWNATLNTESLRGSFRYAVVYSRPSLMRVEVFPTNAAYALQLAAVTPERSVYLDNTTREALVGKAPEEIFEKLFGMELPLEAIVFMLTASVPELEDASFFEGNGLILVQDSQERLFWTLDAASLDITSVEIRPGLLRDLAARISYNDYQAHEGIRFPHRCQVDVLYPSLAGTLSLRAAMVRLNSEIDPKLFEVAIPENFLVLGTLPESRVQPRDLD